MNPFLSGFWSKLKTYFCHLIHNIPPACLQTVLLNGVRSKRYIVDWGVLVDFSLSLLWQRWSSVFHYHQWIYPLRITTIKMKYCFCCACHPLFLMTALYHILMHSFCLSLSVEHRWWIWNSRRRSGGFYCSGRRLECRGWGFGTASRSGEWKLMFGQRIPSWWDGWGLEELEPCCCCW